MRRPECWLQNVQRLDYFLDNCKFTILGLQVKLRKPCLFCRYYTSGHGRWSSSMAPECFQSLRNHLSSMPNFRVALRNPSVSSACNLWFSNNCHAHHAHHHLQRKLTQFAGVTKARGVHLIWVNGSFSTWIMVTWDSKGCSDWLN